MKSYSSLVVLTILSVTTKIFLDPISHHPQLIPINVCSFLIPGNYLYLLWYIIYVHCWNLTPSCLFITPFFSPFSSFHLNPMTNYRLAIFLYALFLCPISRVTAEEHSCPFPLVLPRLPQSHIFGLTYLWATGSRPRKFLAYLMDLKAMPYSGVYCLYCNLIIMSNKCQQMTKWFSLA